jgi:hypothetical protein
VLIPRVCLYHSVLIPSVDCIAANTALTHTVIHGERPVSTAIFHRSSLTFFLTVTPSLFVWVEAVAMVASTAPLPHSLRVSDRYRDDRLRGTAAALGSAEAAMGPAAAAAAAVTWPSHGLAGLEPFICPPVSSVSIAQSPHYVSLLLILLASCIACVIASQAAFCLQHLSLASVAARYQDLLGLALSTPYQLERTFALGGMSVSIVVLTRSFSPGAGRRPQHSSVNWLQKMWSHVYYPSSWTVMLVAFFAFQWTRCLIFNTFDIKSVHEPTRPGTVALGVVEVVLTALQPLWLLHLWKITVPHPATRDASAVAEAGSESSSSSALRRWLMRGLVAVFVVAWVLPSINILYKVYLGGNVQGDGLRYELSCFLTIVACVALASAFVFVDRQRIRLGLLHGELRYYCLALLFQMIIPHYVFEVWSAWFLPGRSDCVAQSVQVASLLVYHVLMTALQLVIRVVSLYTVPKELSLAAVYYAHWFEDLLANLVVARLTPFSGPFWLSALLQAAKSVIRDSNGLRRLARYLVDARPVITIQLQSLRHTTATRWSGASSLLAVEGNLQLLEDAAMESEGASVPVAARPSLLQSVYRDYVECFDLILTRHQNFLCESCSKCVMITALLSQWTYPHRTVPFGGVWDGVGGSSQNRLLIIAGFWVLWAIQLLTHALVLYVLKRQQEPTAPIASRPCSSLALATASQQSCRCSTCILSYSNYEGACGPLSAAIDAEVVDSDGRVWSCGSAVASAMQHARLCLRYVYRPILDPAVHPCLNYWTVHRWFFVLQMMHWIYFLVCNGTQVAYVC